MTSEARPVDTSTTSAPPKKGLWDSLSPSEQKKAVTVFLCSLGVTLLVTGRSGGKLLKRAKAGEASAAPAQAATRATRVRTVRPAVDAIPRRAEPAPRPAAASKPAPAVETPAHTTAAQPVSRPIRKRPQPPPVSILHPNSLTPPKPRRRLLASFISSPVTADDQQRISVLPLSSRPPSPSSYFLPNPTIVATSNAFAQELDKLDKLHEDGADEPAEPAPMDDGFNPAVFAMKALGIATLLSVGSFAVGIYGVMRYLGVDDPESLALALQHRLPSVFDAHRPTVPDWATPKSASAASEDRPAQDPVVEAEELSYWDSVKETLDREAEENRRERRQAWEDRVRQRALALGADASEKRQV